MKPCPRKLTQKFNLANVVFVGVGEHFGRSVEQCEAFADPPLVSDLESFAQGAASDDLSSDFMQWVEVLARIRVQDSAMCALVTCAELPLLRLFLF